PVSDRAFQANDQRLGVPVRCRVFRQRLSAVAVSRHSEACRAMSAAQSLDTVPAALWFLCVLAALLVLFAAGLRLPVPQGAFMRALVRAAVIGGAIGATVLANVALYRHDAQLDLTREQAFTPSAEAREIVRALRQPVDLTYFYQKQDPAARGTKTMLEMLGRLNPYLRVEVVDTDQNPARANRMGVRVYNTAVLNAGDRRIEVLT